MKRKHFNPGTLTAPIPPAMVTVGTMDAPGVLTVAWTGILATHPPKTYVSIRPSRHSYGMLREGGDFVINLPSADLAYAVDYVGIYTGKKVDKFKKAGLTPIKSERVSAPTIAECPVAIECVVTDIVPMGTHDVFVADIVGVSCREELLDEEGKIHFERGDLLAYVHGEYYKLGERVGRFGFSTDRDQAVGVGKPKRAGHDHKSESRQERRGSDSEKAPSAKGGKEERPFYLDAARAKVKRRANSDKNKGKPKGKKAAHK